METAHLLRRNRGGAAKAIGLLKTVGAEVIVPERTRYERVVRLMEQYANVPMDFVDALLVAVAEERSLHEILTLDRRGFDTYRIHGRKRFSILP